MNANSLKRLLDLLIDTGAARYYRDEQGDLNFALFVPLLGELTLEATDEVTSNLLASTKPFVNGTSRQAGHTLCFISISNKQRFDAALRGVLCRLSGYEPLITPKPFVSGDHRSFPTVTADQWDVGSLDETAREASLLAIGYVAYDVRRFGQLLPPGERKTHSTRVMPEFEGLMREAEQLAFRIVRLQRLQSIVVPDDHSEWLTARGFHQRPVRYERSGLNIVKGSSA